MKRVLIVSFCMLFVLTSLVMARPAAKGTTADYNIQIYNDLSDRPLDGFYSAAQADTYMLAVFEFDSLGSCATEGWVGVDLTAQPGVMFHVDNYRVISGLQSMWCGHRASLDEPWCGWAALPGYGNLWDQYLTSVAFPTTGDVTFGFFARYDSEPGYDYTYVDYVDTSGGWVNAGFFDGAGDSIASWVFPAAELPGSFQVRFHFQSDGAWSDEDGLWDTQGAFIVDDITITDNTGTVEAEDWEDEAIGDTQSTDGDWVASAASGFGDFSGLFPGVGVLQQDVCTQDLTCLWGFFKNSPDDYGCGGHPEQLALPKHNAQGQYITNEIWSPWIDLTGGGTVPATASSATFEFYDYRERPLDNLQFMVWHIRTKLGATGCPGSWQDRNFVYYGTGPDWIHVRQPVGDLLTPGDDYVQLALGAWDMCLYWCGIYGTGACHSHSPLFDHVKFYRINTTGPIFSVRDIDLFQDNFPEDGTLTGTVRFDIALDRAPSGSPTIYPGDSSAFDVSEPNFGLGTAADGRAAVYAYVRVTPAHGTPANWEAPEPGLWTPKRFPYLSGPTAGGFYQFQCDTNYSQAGSPVPDRFCFDLNDNFFTPPDRIDFYYAATDGNGTTVYWSQGAGHSLVQADVEADPMEMQCLPTGASDILYVDDFSGRGAQPYFDSVFGLLGINPDRYDVRGPSSLVANGLGSRAAPGQIINVYQKILWNCGDLSIGTIGAGIANSPEKSESAQLLFQFLDQSSAWNPGLYISGDDVSAEMFNLGTPPYSQLFNYISYNLLDGSHVNYGLAIAPLVKGLLPGTIFQHAGVADQMVAFGGCPLINDFDVLQPTGTAAMEMYYDPDQTAGAVISQQTANAATPSMTARVILSGFSFHYIRDDVPSAPLYDRADHLLDILRFFDNPIDDPTTGTGDVPLVTSLSQNYPNPFNPTTTIEFSLADRAHVSLKVYNVAGQLVRTLVNEVRPARVYTATWDGLDESGQPVASGVYFYKLVTKNFTQTRKMVLLK